MISCCATPFMEYEKVYGGTPVNETLIFAALSLLEQIVSLPEMNAVIVGTVSYTHLRAHET